MGGWWLGYLRRLAAPTTATVLLDSLFDCETFATAQRMACSCVTDMSVQPPPTLSEALGCLRGSVGVDADPSAQNRAADVLVVRHKRDTRRDATG